MSRSVAPGWNVRCEWRVEDLNMRNKKDCAFIFMAVTLGSLALLGGCSVNVKKEGGGQDKRVDINTLLGGIHVSKQADVADIGLAVYPGARVKDRDTDGSNKSANVNISGFGYGLKVVALEYKSDDSPAKI